MKIIQENINLIASTVIDKFYLKERKNLHINNITLDYVFENDKFFEIFNDSQKRLVHGLFWFYDDGSEHVKQGFDLLNEGEFVKAHNYWIKLIKHENISKYNCAIFNNLATLKSIMLLNYNSMSNRIGSKVFIDSLFVEFVQLKLVFFESDYFDCFLENLVDLNENRYNNDYSFLFLDQIKNSYRKVQIVYGGNKDYFIELLKIIEFKKKNIYLESFLENYKKDISYFFDEFQKEVNNLVDQIIVYKNNKIRLDLISEIEILFTQFKTNELGYLDYLLSKINKYCGIDSRVLMQRILNYMSQILIEIINFLVSILENNKHILNNLIDLIDRCLNLDKSNFEYLYNLKIEILSRFGTMKNSLILINSNKNYKLNNDMRIELVIQIGLKSIFPFSQKYNLKTENIEVNVNNGSVINFSEVIYAPYSYIFAVIDFELMKDFIKRNVFNKYNKERYLVTKIRMLSKTYLGETKYYQDLKFFNSSLTKQYFKLNDNLIYKVPENNYLNVINQDLVNMYFQKDDFIDVEMLENINYFKKFSLEEKFIGFSGIESHSGIDIPVSFSFFNSDLIQNTFIHIQHVIKFTAFNYNLYLIDELLLHKIELELKRIISQFYDFKKITILFKFYDKYIVDKIEKETTMNDFVNSNNYCCYLEYDNKFSLTKYQFKIKSKEDLFNNENSFKIIKIKDTLKSDYYENNSSEFSVYLNDNSKNIADSIYSKYNLKK